MRKILDEGGARRLAELILPDPGRVVLGEWIARGRCSGKDLELWFPPDLDPGNDAREICAECGVREQCLEYAVEAGEEFGIWGGLDPRERRNLKRRRARARASEAARRSGGAA